MTASLTQTSLATAQATRGHLYWLDWVRFIAALMVVAIHARGGNWLEWGRLGQGSQTKLVAIFFAITRAGTEWVLVFFVLSGFLVGGKLIERIRESSFDLRSYTIDRVSRIWVPLLPALAWSALVAIWVGKPVSWIDLGGNLLGLQGALCENFAVNNPIWSLAYEIWFYVIAGCAAVWLTAGTRARVLAIFGLAVGFAIFTKLDPVFLFAWVLGAATYFLCKGPRLPLLAVAAGAIIAVGYSLSQLRSATVSVDTSTMLPFVPSVAVATLILSMGIALFLPFLTQLRPRSNPGRSIDALGGVFAAFSYTLYLTHYPSLFVWEYYMPERHESVEITSIGWYVLRIVSCLVFAWLCYLPFERRTSRVRKWLRSICGHVPSHRT